MGIKEGALALADELEALERDGCEECIAYDQPECSGELPCAETVALYAARKIREAVERDGEGATTVSAYDLLPEEDRKALEWVRENGGLERVRDLLNWVIGHCSTRQQLDFDFWLSGRVMHELGFEEDVADRDEVERRLLARLMPDNMEWPRFEDGEPVRIGECWGEEDYDTSTTFIERIIFAEDGVYLDNEYNEAFYRPGERVKRPAPKVLDADGVEIRVGDTVWDTTRGKERTVKGLAKDKGEFCVMLHGFDPGYDYMRPTDLTHAKPVPGADGKNLLRGETVYNVVDGEECRVLGFSDCTLDVNVMGEDGSFKAVCHDQLTHQRPVLDADGRPLQAGETVYKLEDSRPYTVKRIDGEHVYINAGGKAFDIWTFPGKLTHEQPDDWSRWREDLELSPVEYADRYRVGRFGHEELDTYRDIVRRARNLAERGE